MTCIIYPHLVGGVSGPSRGVPRAKIYEMRYRMFVLVIFILCFVWFASLFMHYGLHGLLIVLLVFNKF